MIPEHQPVMVEEVIEYLNPERGKVIVDGTIGAGGHARAILERIAPSGRLIGIDRDPKAIAQARRFLDDMAEAVSYYCENFRNIQTILEHEKLKEIDGLLLDVGLSSMQLEDEARGFSFRTDGPLDMRMGPDALKTAAEIVNCASEEELRKILLGFGEERWAGRIAHFIVEARERKRIETTGELVKIIEDAIPVGARRGGRHPARKTFQALRIAVNEELENLKEGILDGVECLAHAGRVVVLTYHSLEDRITKHTLSSLAKGNYDPPDFPLSESTAELKILTKKPVRPSKEEIDRNPRARSAKLRAAEKLR
ncbi:MAG: 16S rRNA (cytosine(1402)-N(4))-methyltransferase RsmH [Actinomycetota bacterium]|nr:16S rRNA (cytosine(1402)-N(4))-methyltransferase RsmH [Actinomycetota bacterium]